MICHVEEMYRLYDPWKSEDIQSQELVKDGSGMQ